jgi:hypothetical protein
MKRLSYDALSILNKDFEDSIIMSSASLNNMNYIITRNLKDFKNSPVRAITPSEIIEEIN